MFITHNFCLSKRCRLITYQLNADAEVTNTNKIDK